MTKLTKEEWQRVADIVAMYCERGPVSAEWTRNRLMNLSWKMDEVAERCEE